MAWTETEPGTFVQDMGNLEKVYRKLSQAFKSFNREHWGLYCVCGVEFGPNLSPEARPGALRNGWIALRAEYPGLSVIPNDTAKVFKAPDAQGHAIEKWADETFVVETARDADSILAEYEPRDLPCLYYLPASSEIVFLVSHWRTDALGVLMLLDRLFTLVSSNPDVESIVWRNDVENISPSLEDAGGSAVTGTPEMEKYAKDFINHHHQVALHAGGLPYRGDDKTPPTNPSRHGIAFTEASTAALIHACKKRNISVTAAVHAALGDTVFSLDPVQGRTQYAAVMSVNMRPYLPSPYSTKSHACQTYVAGMTPAVNRDSSFLEKTRTLTDFYRNAYSDKFMQALRLISGTHAKALFTPRPADAPPPKPPSSVSLSSLGVIEKHLVGGYGNEIGVKSFRFGVTMMTRQLLLYLWTFKGQLNLSGNYNEAYHDAASTDDFLVRISRALERELALELVKV